MSNKRVLDKIIAVLAGIAIWAYVISVQDPVTNDVIKAVPVQLTNIESMEKAGLAIAGTGEYTVDVVIAGSRSHINEVKAADFIATADVSGLTVGQNYITVNVDAPSNITVSEIRTQKIQVYVDNLVSVEKEVSLSFANIPEGQELGSTSLGIETVTVSGAKSLVNNVVVAKAVLDGENMVLDEPQTMELNLVPIDADGNAVNGVRMSESSVEVKSCLYQTKEVALDVPIGGELNEHISIRSEIIPASVIVKGPGRILNDVWQIEADAIDRSQITESCSIPLNLILPEGLEIANASKNISVDYELKGRVEKTVNIESHRIVFMNLAEGLNILPVDELGELKLSIYEDEEEILDSDSITIAIDLEGLFEGEHELKYEIGFADNLEDVIVVEAPETIKVVIGSGDTN